MNGTTTTFEKDLLLAFVAYHMDAELRHKIMVALPEAYNHWFDAYYVRTVRASDGEAL